MITGARDERGGVAEDGALSGETTFDKQRGLFLQQRNALVRRRRRRRSQVDVQNGFSQSSCCSRTWRHWRPTRRSIPSEVAPAAKLNLPVERIVIDANETLWAVARRG